MDERYFRFDANAHGRPREADRERWEAQARLPYPEMKPGPRTRQWEMDVGRAKAALRRLDEVRELRARGIEVEDAPEEDVPW